MGWMKYGITASLVVVVGVFGSYMYMQQNSSSSGRPGSKTSASESALPEGLDPSLRATYHHALRGDPMAMYSIATAYASGERAKQDYAEAAKWFRKAAYAGSSDAMIALGSLYRQGEGVTKDHDEAAHWYGKAAELGNPRGQVELQQLQTEPSVKTPPR